MENIGEYPGNTDCETCQIFVYPKDCFNQHVGSIAALEIWGQSRNS
jgi:hypothetical protein